MVRRRDGAEVDLLDSSIRTAGGATLSTTLYVLSGIVYAFVTSPAATGTYFFISISAALLLRPVSGLSKTLQKIGSERGERVEQYFGLALLFAGAYLLLVGGGTILGADALARVTVFDSALLGPAVLYACSVALLTLTNSLVAAIGYPSAETWLTGSTSAVQLCLLLVFNEMIATAGDLLLVVAGVRFALFIPVVVGLRVVPTRPDRHTIERAWAFGKWSVPDQVLDRFAYNMPVYVLGVVATPVAVGVYEAADRFADFGATVAWRLSSPLLTKVSGDSSVGRDVSAYLDGAITGGTGVTFLVLAYLLSAHDIVAEIAFAGAQRPFSIAVLTVGSVNLLRGFWTLASHAMEGVGKPSISFWTKLYGLLFSVPVPAVFGAEFGAIAGAAGYGVMNVVIFAYVIYYARPVLGGIPIDWGLVGRFLAALVVAAAVTAGVTVALESVVTPIPLAVVAAALCLLAFVGVLLVISRATRRAAGRASELSIGWIREAV